MRTARARTSVEKRFPGFPFSIAYLPSFWLSGKPGLVQIDLPAIEAPLPAPEPVAPVPVELRLANGRCLRFDSAMDTAALTRLIRAVEKA